MNHDEELDFDPDMSWDRVGGTLDLLEQHDDLDGRAVMDRFGRRWQDEQG